MTYREEVKENALKPYLKIIQGEIRATFLNINSCDMCCRGANFDLLDKFIEHSFLSLSKNLHGTIRSISNPAMDIIRSGSSPDEISKTYSLNYTMYNYMHSLHIFIFLNQRAVFSSPSRRLTFGFQPRFFIRLASRAILYTSPFLGGL